MTPIAQWLRDTRKRQRTPEGRPWSQEYTVERINEWASATGQKRGDGQPWQLYRPNYVGYEGETRPESETVARLVAFWASRGEPGPDLTPPAPVADPQVRMAVALESIAESLLSLRLEVAQASGASLGATQHLGAQLTAILERMPSEPDRAGTS